MSGEHAEVLDLGGRWRGCRPVPVRPANRSNVTALRRRRRFQQQRGDNAVALATATAPRWASRATFHDSVAAMLSF
jgi:hypothetical protein